MESQENTTNPAIKPKVLKGYRILVAEDNDFNMMLATTILEKHGAEIDEAENGVQAIDKLSTNNFDLILMDLQMPEMGGIEATSVIRQKLNNDIPIIALTGNGAEGDDKACFEVGMNGYIGKPFEEDEFIKVIVANIPSKEDSVPYYNLDRLIETCNGNQEILDKMVAIFVKQTPVLANEMLQQYSEGNIEKMKATAHQIKPSIEYVCDKVTREEIQKIENYNPTIEPSFEFEKMLNHTVNKLVLIANDAARISWTV